MLSFLAMLAMPLFCAPEDGNGGQGGASPGAEDNSTDEAAGGETPGGDANGAPAPEKPAPDDAAARAEVKRLKAQLAKFEKERQAREEAELSDLEKAQKQAERFKAEAEAARAEAREMKIGVALSNAAHQLGLKNPEQTLRMVDRSLVTLDEAGQVVGAKAAIEALKEVVPFAFAEAQDGAPGSTSSADSGKSKMSDRSGSKTEPENDRDRGRQAAKRIKEKRDNLRL